MEVPLGWKHTITRTQALLKGGENRGGAEKSFLKNVYVDEGANIKKARFCTISQWGKANARV